MRSTKPCMTRKIGADLATATRLMVRQMTTTTKSTHPMAGSMPKASMMATTLVTGTGPIMVKHMSRVCCTTLASERARVTMEPAPKRLKSAAESLSEWSYTMVRRSRPTFAARRAANQ